jgi:hypothetical protein
MVLGPLCPIGPTGPPGSVKPNRLRSGSVNRPSPTPSRSSFSPQAHWRYLGRRRRRLAIPADPGELCCRHLGRNTPLYTLSRLHQADLSPAPAPRRSAARCHSGTRFSAAAVLGLSPAFSWCQLRSLRWPWWLSGIGGSIHGGCSLCCDAAAGEDFLGLRLVGRVSPASPCYPGLHLGDWWVLVSSSTCPFLLWPLSLAILAECQALCADAIATVCC